MANDANKQMILLGLSGMIEIVKLVQMYSSDPAATPEAIAAKVMRSEEASKAALKKWQETP